MHHGVKIVGPFRIGAAAVHMADLGPGGEEPPQFVGIAVPGDPGHHGVVAVARLLVPERGPEATQNALILEPPDKLEHLFLVHADGLGNSPEGSGAAIKVIAGQGQNPLFGFGKLRFGHAGVHTCLPSAMQPNSSPATAKSRPARPKQGQALARHAAPGYHPGMNKQQSSQRVSVLGAGAWGTTLADMLARNNVPTTLWVREPDLADRMRDQRVNDVFLPDIPLSDRLGIESDPATALEGADAYLLVVPSQFIRPTLENFRDLFPKRPVMVCASKGIELDSLAPMSQVVAESLEDKAPRYASLSGPSFAAEVSRDMPTSVALGCADMDLARQLRELFSTPFFRVYSTPDYRGVELGGAVKNVIALAAGMSDGLGFGHDARAALITRGLAEMSRLGEAMGAQERTFMGLSGMGDLVLTCTGDLSRNRQVGLKLGQGRKLDDIIGEMKAVAEGVKTAKSLYALSQKLGVELPITEQVHRILYEDAEPREAVTRLMGRALKDE